MWVQSITRHKYDLDAVIVWMGAVKVSGGLWVNSISFKQKIQQGENRKSLYLPVSLVPNTLLSRDAFEPVMTTFFPSSWSLRTNVSNVSMFWISSKK